MSYLLSVNINTQRLHPFPFDIPAIKFAKNIDLSQTVTFFIGDNGTGKSTLLESIAFRLQIPHMDGSDYGKSSFKAASGIIPNLELGWNVERSIGFFFRAEDFGDLINSVNRTDQALHADLKSLHGEVLDRIINEMKGQFAIVSYEKELWLGFTVFFSWRSLFVNNSRKD